MGKIRVKGLEEMTPEQEAKEKAKKEAKKAEKIAAKNAQRAAEGKKVNPQTEAIVNEAAEATVDAPAEEVVTTTPSETVEAEEAPKKKKKEKFVKAHTKVESKRHKENLTHVSKSQSYNITQGLEALRKFKTSKFDETVELHINTKEKGINGQVVLPHGTGKTLVIKIADEAIIAEVAKGKINFDVLIAVPSMMPQLARVAKVLGPRGLMPNPKNGTITDKPEDAVKKLSGGQVNYKTESAAPIIHAIVGKVSFDDKKLEENIKTFIGSVGMANINSVTLKSTMSPAIRINIH
jgi:large subunit ribosomal protein L1